MLIFGSVAGAGSGLSAYSPNNTGPNDDYHRIAPRFGDGLGHHPRLQEHATWRCQLVRDQSARMWRVTRVVPGRLATELQQLNWDKGWSVDDRVRALAPELAARDDRERDRNGHILLRLVLAVRPQAAEILDRLEELVRLYPVAAQPATGCREYVKTTISTSGSSVFCA
jgi:hypothetical protein